MTLQQQVRQELAASLQRVREDMHTAIKGRLGAISSISSGMQRLSAGPAEAAKLYRISDLTPKSWDGSHDKGQFRNFMAELYLWMQAWSDQSERNLVRVEGLTKLKAQHWLWGRFGKIRDKEKTLAVKRLMPKSLLNYRFRGTTIPREELLMALESVIIDKVTTHSASKVKNIDTSAPV